jgi:phage repressor protein C with HTH and peptisase S24 domain
MMMDFIEHGSRDPYLYVDYSNSYYNFFVKVEKSEISVLTAQEIKILELFAKEINNGKRIVECYILKLLIELESIDFEEIKTVISTNYNYKISKETYNSCINNLNFKFVRKEEEIIKIYNDKLIISKSFYKMMQNKTFKDFLIDNINYSIFSFNKQYKKELFKDGFILYQKYSRKDVCRILNWDLNEEATVYGYKLSNNSCPIFVNYHKEENIASSTKFPEKFLNSSQFLWYTKPQRRLSNSTIAAIKNHNNQLRLPLFMKKHNGEGTDFYFMGDVKPIDESFEETTIKNDQNNDVPVVKVILELATPVESTIYNYLTYKETDKEFPNNVSILNSNIEQYIINPIPLYDFYAAAGTFSEMQSEKDFILIEGPENYNPNNDYFACKIMGESMNRVIPNDSICLFKKYTGGSRNGKILLIEYRDIQDPDFNSAFTIKTYTSEKNIKEENWEHTSIILRPNSYDSSYQNIIITDENAQGMRVVGEFVQIMKECIK